MFICLRKAKEYLNEKGIVVYDTAVGPYVTCQEKSGISFSITKLNDELKNIGICPVNLFVIPNFKMGMKI